MSKRPSLIIPLNYSARRGNPLMQSPADAASEERIEVVQGDQTLLHLYFAAAPQAVGGAAANVRLPSGAAIVAAAKLAADLAGSTLLLCVSDFTEREIPPAAVDALSTYYYEGFADFDADEVHEAFGLISGNELSCLVDVEVSLPAELGPPAYPASRKTLQIALTLKRQVYSGEEDEPSYTGLGPAPQNASVVATDPDGARTWRALGVYGANADAYAIVMRGTGLTVGNFSTVVWQTDMHRDTFRDSLNLGNAATRNAGTSSGQVPLIGLGGKLPFSVIPELGVDTLNDTIATDPEAVRTALELPTIAAVGAVAGAVVTLGTGGKLPALDGSALTNLPGGGGSHDQAPGTVLAGPAGGSPQAPAFRTLANADLGSITALTSSTDLTLSSSGSNKSVILKPTGAGRVRIPGGQSQTWDIGPSQSYGYNFPFLLNGAEKASIDNAGNVNAGSFSASGTIYFKAYSGTSGHICDSNNNPVDLRLRSLTATGPLVYPSYTVATVPSAASWTRGQIYVADESGGAVLAYSDGTNWRRVTDRAPIS